eukprot:Sdes_comp19345_c0_seq1m10566
MRTRKRAKPETGWDRLNDNGCESKGTNQVMEVEAETGGLSPQVLISDKENIELSTCDSGEKKVAEKKKKILKNKNLAPTTLKEKKSSPPKTISPEKTLKRKILNFVTSGKLRKKDSTTQLATLSETLILPQNGPPKQCQVFHCQCSKYNFQTPDYFHICLDCKHQETSHRIPSDQDSIFSQLVSHATHSLCGVDSCSCQGFIAPSMDPCVGVKRCFCHKCG